MSGGGGPSQPACSDAAYVAGLLQDLCREPRPAGSARGAAVASELADRYRGMGYAVRRETHEFTGWELTAPPRVRLLAPECRDLADCLPVVWSGPTPGPVEGRIVPGAGGLPPTLTTFEAYEWDCLPVVNAGGAVAACLLTGPRTWPQPRDDASNPLPLVMVSPADGAFIRQCLSRGVEVRVGVEVGSRYLPGRTLTNVIAGPPAGASSPSPPAIVVAAHYDSFFTTVGAHDNASGTAALLCLARRLADVPPARPFRVISFDAEEWNKLGSSRHVESMERAGRLSEVKAMINLDSVAVGTGIYLSVAPAHARSLSTALRSATADVLRRRRVVVHPDPHAAPFDSWPFARRGIPAVQIGSFGPEPFPHWHRPADNPAGIGPAGHALILDVVALAAELVTRWEPGGQ